MSSFVWFFLFNQSKTNAVLELWTRHYRGLVGFEAKDQNLNFEAKDFKKCSRGQERPRGLHQTRSCTIRPITILKIASLISINYLL